MPENFDDTTDGEEYEEEYDSEEYEEDEDEIEEKIDEGRRRLLCGLGAFTISLPFIALGTRESCSEAINENPALAYIGIWQKEDFRIRIQNWPEDEKDMPSEIIPLGNQGEARLILPVVAYMKVKRSMNYQAMFHGVDDIYGGVYDVNGLNVLILYFEIKEFRKMYGKKKSIGFNMAFGIRKGDGDTIELSAVPKIQNKLIGKSWKIKIETKTNEWIPLKRVSQ